MSKILILLFLLLCIIFIFLLVLFINSPGKITPLKDTQGNVIEGSISEKIWVDINGIRQGMFIRGENIQNPVLLYLHGGPGTPLFQFISYLEKEKRLEKYFTVCYWDQRGAGMTYNKSTDSSSMTVEQMAADAHEVTNYLRSRFGQEKICLAGHSWGSYLGVKTIEKYPENYLAYIGIGQVSDQTESERLAYHYMLNKAKEMNDKTVIKKLVKYDSSSDEFPQLHYLLKVRTGILNRYHIGHLHQDITFLDILKSLFIFKGYTITEKINWFRGADFSMLYLFPALLGDNLFISSVKFEVPFYIAQGTHDYMVSQVLAEKYLDVIDAPKKEFIPFPDSAHSPNMEEPEKFIELVRKIALENPI